MPSKKFSTLPRLEQWKEEARFWQRRAKRNRKYLEQCFVALSANDKETALNILTKALDATAEETDLNGNRP